MKMKKALHKLLAMCMVVMSILFIMPNIICRAVITNGGHYYM
jgi:hypothetical protein